MNGAYVLEFTRDVCSPEGVSRHRAIVRSAAGFFERSGGTGTEATGTLVLGYEIKTAEDMRAWLPQRRASALHCGEKNVAEEFTHSEGWFCAGMLGRRAVICGALRHSRAFAQIPSQHAYIDLSDPEFWYSKHIEVFYGSTLLKNLKNLALNKRIPVGCCRNYDTSNMQHII